MFHFMKKERSERDKEDKERRKREKRERKQLLKEQQLFQQQQQLTAEDLRRLDEVRRSLRGDGDDGTGGGGGQGGGLGHQSGDGFDASNLENLPSSSSCESAPPPPRPPHLSRPSTLPPPPPSRGILKGKSSNSKASAASAASAATAASDADAAALLLKNTQANEAILYENLAREKRRQGEKQRSPNKKEPSLPRLSPGDSQDREVSYESVPATFRVRAHRDHVSPVSPPKRNQKQRLPVMSPGELKALVTGEGLGANQRPLSSEFEVHLPGAAAEEGEDGGGRGGFQLERELCFQRVEMGDQRRAKAGDYGLAVRKGVLKTSGSGREKEVVLVEAKERKMMPGGEVLLEVNGTSVSGMSREEVERALEETAGQQIVVKVRRVSAPPRPPLQKKG